MRYVAMLLCVLSLPVWALSFPITPGSDVVGKLQCLQVAKQDDWYAPIARQYNVGFNELKNANPGLSPDGPGKNTVLILPTRYLLPNVPHQGIVINVAEMRLYYFPLNQPNIVYTFPVGVGKQNWNTPLGKLTIYAKIKNPIWIVPDSIMAFRQAHGDPINKIVREGPDDPLGAYAMRLSNMTYLIHGTNEPDGVGMRSSAGCIRMYPENIKALFAMTPIHTPVRIINEPFKLGWVKNTLYLSVYPVLSETKANPGAALLQLISVVKQASYAKPIRVNWPKINTMFKAHEGIAQPISLALHADQSHGE